MHPVVTKVDRLKGLANFLIYFGLQIILSIIIMVVLSSVYQLNFQQVLGKYAGIISFIPLVIIFLVIYVINFKELNKKIWENLRNYKTYLFALAGFFGYFAALIILAALTSLLSPDLPTADNQQIIENMFSNQKLIILFLSIVIFAPIVEELVFRYSLVNLFYINVKYLRWLTYLIVAIIFAAIHETSIFVSGLDTTNSLLFLTYFVPALILSYMYMFTKHNLLAVILLHMAINFLSFISLSLMS